MKSAIFFTLATLLFTAGSDAAECESGWQIYKDQLCIKTFPSIFLSYDEAKNFCSEQGGHASKSSLVMVNEAELQDLLVNYTGDIYDNMWLGGRYHEESAQFVWDDGTPLTYTNWQENSPRSDCDSNICIEMRPINSRSSKNTPGKWIDVNCNKRNMVICQKLPSWSLDDAVGEIIKLRKELVEATEERKQLQEQLVATQREFATTKQNLETADQRISQDIERVSSRVVPVGSVYIEYFNQSNPGSLWPDYTWEDVTSKYAGLFFRASGGESADWGTTQGQCAPRIHKMEFKEVGSSASSTLNIPESGASAYGLAGYNFYFGPRGYEGLRFTTTGCEVRPVNQAIRIWRRTG